MLNFICSCHSGAADVDLDTLVVFLGQPEYAPLIESMGAKAVYVAEWDPLCGPLQH